MKYRVLLIVLACSLCLAANDAPVAAPTSPAAIAALGKLKASTAKAKADYDAAVRSAQALAIQELDAAKAAAMKGGNLNEANAIQATEQSIGKAAGSPAASIETKIIGKKWAYGGDEKTVITYKPGGIVESPAWKNGKAGTWAQVDANTIMQKEPAGAVIKITFDADFANALWVYQNNSHIAYATASR